MLGICIFGFFYVVGCYRVMIVLNLGVSVVVIGLVCGFIVMVEFFSVLV